jgi:hypothetical protein
MKSILFIALVFSTQLLHAGDFKRFYAPDPGEEISALTAIPGDGVVITSKKNDGSGQVVRVLLPERQLALRLPEGAVAVAASGDYGVIFRQGGALYRKPVGPLAPTVRLAADPEGKVAVSELSAKGLTLTLGEEPAISTAPVPKWPAATHPCDPAAAKTPLLITPVRIMLSRDNGHDLLVVEDIEGGKVIIDHGQCGAEFIWTFISTSRGALLLPARRTVQLYGPEDGARLAKTTISKEVPQKDILVLWRSLSEPGGAHLIVLTGPGLEWWGPQAKHLEQWGEVIVKTESAAK